MEKAVLQAIKKDDLKSFEELYKTSDVGNFCYGRFPVLSLLYLYNSKKIIKKYFSSLLTVDEYKFLPEDVPSYVLFIKKASKCIRLYPDGTVVSPLEMMMILDRSKDLKKAYALAKKNPTIKANLKKIYRIKYDLDVKYDGDLIVAEKRPLTKGEKKKILIGALGSFLIVCLCISTPFVVNVFYPFIPSGNNPNDPSDSTPITVTVSEIKEVTFKSKNTYNLSADSVLTVSETIATSSCKINGNKNVVAVKTNAYPLFKKIDGTIKDVTFDFGEVDLSVTEATSLLCDENAGTLDNVTIKVNGKITTSVLNEPSSSTQSSLEDIYNDVNKKTYVTLSGVTYYNSGTIKNSVAHLDLSLSGAVKANSCFSAFAAVNTGTISYCETTGTINADTVDVSGTVNFNYSSVVGCVNSASITQVSSDDGWSPLVAGIAVTNAKSIKKCENKGALKVSSNAPKINDNTLRYVRASGITQDNYGVVDSCNNEANIEASGVFARVETAGIAGNNLYDKYAGSVSSSANSGKLSSTVEQGKIFTAGIVACVSDGKIYGNTSDGEISYNQTGEFYKYNEVFAGGVIAFSESNDFPRLISTTLSSCTSTAVINGSVNGSTVFCGGIAGYGSNISVSECLSKSEKIAISGKSGTDDQTLSLGGIIGMNHNYSQIVNCLNRSTLRSEYLGEQAIGGIAGDNYYVVDKSVNYGSLYVNGGEQAIGGIAGDNYYVVANSVNYGSLYVNGDDLAYVGGIVGNNIVMSAIAQVTSCVSEGTIIEEVDSNVHFIGGIAGYNRSLTTTQGVSYSAIINNSYAANEVTRRESSRYGGVVGLCDEFGYFNNEIDQEVLSSDDFIYYIEDVAFFEADESVYDVGYYLQDNKDLKATGYLVKGSRAKSSESLKNNRAYEKIIDGVKTLNK